MEEREYREQQDGGVKEKVVELSVQSGVSSSFTAFIAVNKGSGEAVQGPLIRRNVPTPRMYLRAISSPVKYCAGSSLHLQMRRHAHMASPQTGKLKLSKKLKEGFEEVRKDPLIQLVSLQKASGSWVLEPALAAALGKTNEEVKKPKPASVNDEVWATILALIWLHGCKTDDQEEWELLAMKAVSWLHAQNAPCMTECVEAGNALLGCKVQKDALGL
ncbi:hypothetical protein LDENG_00202770 [Lucifuga dentata]|nr:hypothetical protein LDENG_00202770 [Lucifuga dentata]